MPEYWPAASECLPSRLPKTSMEQPTSTYDLLTRIEQGDEYAFRALFEKYQKRLALLIHYKLGHEMRRLADVEVLSWLSRITDHVIADAARFHGRQKRRAELVRFRSVGTPDGPEPVDSATPSRLLAEKEGLQELIQKLDSLPEDYRRAILLAKVEGLSNAEMAEQLGRSREAAALLLHRAIKRFRAIQEQDIR